MMKVILGVVAALLVVAAAVVLFRSGGVLKTQQKTNPQATSSANKTANGVASTPGKNAPSWTASLSALEQSLFAVPSSSASEDEKTKYHDLLLKNTLKSDQLHIGQDCQPKPLVYSVEKATEINFKNDDSSDHTITMTNNEKYVIPASNSTIVKVSQDLRGKITSYGCDQFGRVGFLVIAS